MIRFSVATTANFAMYMLCQDDNRYNAGRGAHIMLKRAEKARVLVSKIPGETPLLSMLFCLFF